MAPVTRPGVHPVLFVAGGVVVHSYRALLYVGVVAGVIAGNAAAHVAGLDPFRTWVVTIVLLVPALAGARLLVVATHWDQFRGDRAQIWDHTRGGAAMIGGVPAMLLASLPVLASASLPFGAYWDVATFTILLALVFSRIGCLLNGCCAGTVWSLPLQLVDAGLAVLVLLVAWAALGRAPFDGAVFLGAAGGYSLGRVALEGNRARQGDAAFSRRLWALLLVAVAVCFAIAWAL